jgi:F-type H+-transporting ATPase subunit delta
MKISKQNRRDAKELFRSCFVDGMLNEERAKLAVQKIISLRPRGYMGILAQFQRLVKLDADRRSAVIESAVPLAPDLQAKLQSDLSGRYGQELNFSFGHKPELIGGLRVRVGSDVYDGTVQARLAALAESF